MTEKTHPRFPWEKVVCSGAGPANPTTRHVLLTIATHADRAGRAFPSMRTLSTETRLAVLSPVTGETGIAVKGRGRSPGGVAATRTERDLGRANIGEPSGPEQQLLTLGRARRAVGCFPIGVKGRLMTSGAFQEMSADCQQAHG